MPDLLRLVIAGSVDSGKSTTIGRLLFDSKQILDDQLAQIERASIRRSRGHLDLSLLTDGLRAEREQGITIDVAYRYFATSRRAFVVADTPGHVQYTRNMVTGASTASLCILVVGIDLGLVEQTRRHAVVASLLGVRSLVVAVNKMDLVGFEEEPLTQLRREFDDFLADLSFEDVRFIPISALRGDNIVRSSDDLTWYKGPALLELLESVPVPLDDRLDHLRLPIQHVVRTADGRGESRSYAGRIASGAIRVGDDVLVLPSNLRSRVRTITVAGKAADSARSQESVALTLEDDLDISRGHMIADPVHPPVAMRSFDALICWMGHDQLRTGSRYALKHTTNWSRVVVERIGHRFDLKHLRHREVLSALGPNDLGQISLRSLSPLFADPYQSNRTTGSFILVDEATNDTVAAGMITMPHSPG